MDERVMSHSGSSQGRSVVMFYVSSAIGSPLRAFKIIQELGILRSLEEKGEQIRCYDSMPGPDENSMVGRDVVHLP